MHPHTDTALAGRSEPGLDVFAAAMRSVLRTRHDSPGDGPEALEEWSPAGGYVWRWSTDTGLWRVTVGEVADPRPLLHGPGGIWRVDTPASEAAGLVLLMLRAAGAIPGTAPTAPARTLYAVVGGKLIAPADPPEPPRAVVLRASDPEPDLPPGYVAVRAASDEPDADGRWDVLLPDGYSRHPYDPAARRCLVPYETPDGEPEPLTGSRGTTLLLFEPGQTPYRFPAGAPNVRRGAA